ncbi:MAG: acetyl-CoA carboxylase biotin carboxyl carrier protein [Parvularculaceae bacterium]
MTAKKKDGEHGLEAAWIRELAEILDETGLTEVEIEKNDIRLRVSRQGGGAMLHAPVHAAPASAGDAASGADAAPVPPASAADHPGVVKSPMVGTAYLAPSPGAAAFVKEGDEVAEGQTLMIIEAMKTMNPIAAPRAGVVKIIIVADAQPVEYDDPLLIIE